MFYLLYFILQHLILADGQIGECKIQTKQIFNVADTDILKQAGTRLQLLVGYPLLHLNSFTPFAVVYTLDGLSVSLKADAFSPSLPAVCSSGVCRPAGAGWSADLSDVAVSMVRCLLLHPGDTELVGRLERRAQALADRIATKKEPDGFSYVRAALLWPPAAIYIDDRRVWECAECHLPLVMRELNKWRAAYS